jgi:CRP/FNR family cyclic AMP-dependent transcriptional regulator
LGIEQFLFGTAMAAVFCKIELLRNLPLLSLLTDEQLTCMIPTLRRRSYLPRTFVVCSGNTSEGLYFILSGTVHVIHEDGDAREVIIAALGPNEFFGEWSLFQVAPRLQSAQAQDACEILFIPRTLLLEMLQRNSAAAMFMMRVLADRLAAAQRQIASFALVDVYGRVARLLLEQVRVNNAGSVVELRSTVIAAMVGASREMVSRVVREMIEQGILRRNKRRLVIMDRVALGRAAARNAHHPRPYPGERGASQCDGARVVDRPIEHAPTC